MPRKADSTNSSINLFQKTALVEGKRNFNREYQLDGDTYFKLGSDLEVLSLCRSKK